MKSLVLRLAWLAAIGALHFGCGGDGGGSSCQDVNRRICERACACTAGDECKIASGGATITHDNQADCVGFWVTFGCMQSGANKVDYAACSSALDDARCSDSAGGMALEFPAACSDTKQPDAGS